MGTPMRSWFCAMAAPGADRLSATQRLNSQACAQVLMFSCRGIEFIVGLICNRQTCRTPGPRRGPTIRIISAPSHLMSNHPVLFLPGRVE